LDLDIWYGVYSYTLTANYDLTSYGSPGQYGTSPPAGPVDIDFSCSCPLPMVENWDWAPLILTAGGLSLINPTGAYGIHWGTLLHAQFLTAAPVSGTMKLRSSR